jgi:hypothetical protein
MDDEKPDTRHLRLKPKDIIPTDGRSSPGDGTAISVRLMHRENQLAEDRSLRGKPGDRRLSLNGGGSSPALPPVFKPKEIVLTDASVGRDDEEAISVPGILLENRLADQKSGWGRIKRWKKRKSRRDRDFILTVGTIDFAIAILMKVMPGAVTMIYGIAGITLVTSMTAWVMYVVNDDY